MSMEPQSCYKCNSLPEDILMLACGHDLCLDCAAQRLSMETTKKPATGIVCEFCNQRTQLDSESVRELEKIMLDIQSRRVKRDLKEPTIKRPDTESRRLDKYGASRTDKRVDIDVKPIGSYSDYPKDPIGSKSPIAPSAYMDVSKRNCPEHPEEQLLYYCFECNVECICPECVIHGKHKNHDVKTLKKSQPIIKGKLENLLENIHSNVDGLASRKSEFQKHIREVTEQNNASKKQIQKGFSDLRQRLANKENQILAKCDMALEMTVQDYEKGIKSIVRRIDEIKQSSQNIVDTLRRDELTLLNYFARNKTSLEEVVKKVDLGSFVRQDARKILNNEATLKLIGKATEEIVAIDIDSTIKYDPKYDQPRVASKINEREFEAQLEYQRPARDVDKPRDYLRKY